MTSYQGHAHKNGQAGILGGAGNDQRHNDHSEGIENKQHRHGGLIAAGQAAAFAVAVQLLQELGGIGSIGVVQGMAHGAASFLIWIFTESQKRNSME